MPATMQVAANAVVDFDRLLKSVHAIGRDVLAVHANEVDRDARFPRESIDALRREKLLSAAVPAEFGGHGLNIIQIGRICEVLGQYCSSSAMVYAMHMIQVACIVRHVGESEFFRSYMRRIVGEQLLLASATTEVGVGGDLRSSICAIEINGDSFQLTKKAPVISYGEEADAILVTCRRSASASAGEQVQVLVERGDFETERISNWDTLGFRGTCSSGFVLKSSGSVEQILPGPFADILSVTMHPYSHVVWCSLWSGIAMDALNLARAFVRAEARKKPGETPISALRLAETDLILQEMRHNVQAFAREYHELLEQHNPEAFRGFGFSIRTNNLKLACSQRIIDIVSRSMLICGISGYRNDSKFSLGRHLRDSYGAALMVNNDRITQLNATLLLAHKEGPR